MTTIDVELPDDWRPWQAEAWQAINQHRFSVLVVHRRAGKSVLCCLWLIAGLLERNDRVGAYLGPFAKQVRTNIWPLFRRLAGQVPGVVFNETELRASFPNGSCVYFLGTENADAIRGAGLDLAVLDEVSQIGPSAWATVIRPALADRSGRAVFIGTPLGASNLFAQLYERAAETPGWHRMLLKWSDTAVLPAEEIEALKRELTREEFEQEFECSFSAAVRGAYYGRLMAEAEAAGRIGRVPHDPALPVWTSWDLGLDDLTVVWFWQVVGSEVRAIDLQAWRGTGLPDIAQALRAKPYAYGGHYAPHDAKVRELGTGKSRQEMAQALGLAWTIVPEVGLASGIEQVRALLPRVWFDREKCRDGIEALKTYRTEYDDIRRVFSAKPLHSWESDYCDSVRYFAIGSQGRRPDRRPLDYSRLDRAVI